jgi:glycosyltransferase involved in cell wall biosynthesis
MQLVGPDQAVAYSDILALCRHHHRLGDQITVAGPLSRLQQEQIMLTGAAWVNLPLAPWSTPSGRAENARQLSRLLRTKPVDLVHCYGLSAAAIAASARRFLRPRPRLIVTLDDLSAHHLSTRKRWSVSRLLSRFDGLIVAAESEATALAALSPRLASRARLLHFSASLRPITSDFDLARKRRSLGLRAETAVIGVIAPAVRGLGLETFISAAGQINDRFPNVEFLIVGDGPEQQDLIMQAHHQGSGGAVVFRGTRADLPEIVASLNILVIPRETPGCLVHALQALSQEIPVIAVPTPALREIIAPVDPEAFVPPDDVEALVRELSQRLEILPPPELDEFSESDFSYRQMIVSGAGFDLDQVGLEARWRGDESEMQRALHRAQEKYSARETLQVIEELYRIASEDHGIRDRLVVRP